MNRRVLSPICGCRMLWALTAVAIHSVASIAMAIPPHPHDQGKIEYPNPLPGGFAPHSGGANDANHSHVGGVSVKEVNPSAFGGVGPHMVDSVVGAANETWRSYASWDDRVWRNGDLAAVVTYGHGYIQPTDATRPRYLFGPNIPAADLAAVKARILSIWQDWETAAKAQGEGSRTTPDGTALLTDLSFRETAAADGGAFELDIDFQNLAGAYASWNPNNRQLRFEPTADVQVYVNDPGNLGNPHPDWQVSHDALALGGAKAWAAMTPVINLPWNFTVGAPTTAGVTNGGDLDYRCVNAAGCNGGAIAFGTNFEGTEAAFLALGLSVADDAPFLTLTAAVDQPIVQADFLSVATHEWGHVLGLDHIVPGGSIMNAAIPFTLLGTRRTIEAGSAIGAAVLYSIPVPEPGAITLLAIGLVGIVARKRKR